MDNFETNELTRQAELHKKVMHKLKVELYSLERFFYLDDMVQVLDEIVKERKLENNT